jgi:hypothetical protein
MEEKDDYNSASDSSYATEESESENGYEYDSTSSTEMRVRRSETRV